MKILIDNQKLAVLSMKNNMTRDQLSEVSMVSKSTISKISSGYPVQQRTAEKLCRALDVQIDELAASSTC